MRDEPVLPRSKGPYYTATFRPDPPTIPISENGSLQLLKFAKHCADFEGYEEVARNERFYEVEVLLRRRD